MNCQRLWFVCALVLYAFSFAGCNTTPDKRLLQYLNQSGFGNRYSGHADEENWIAIGDSIEIEDPTNEELNRSEVVDIDGTVVLPEVGAVRVAGMTRTEVEAFLTEKYSPYFPVLDIKVRIKTKNKKYFVFGEVATEGEVDFEGDLTLFQAVIRANPTRETANMGRVKLIRADPLDPHVIVVDLTEIITHGDSTFNILVHERDIIYIPPTILAQLGYFLEALLFPITHVLNSLYSAIFTLPRFWSGGYYGGTNNNQGGIY